MQFPKLKNRVILAPMAGVTDIAFRELCVRYGASLTYTEMINATAILHKNKATEKLLHVSSKEKPVAVQLFGNNAEEIASAAKIIGKKFDIIDINCGCPVGKVTKIGAGCALMAKPDKIKEIIEKTIAKIKKPVTIKIRAGTDEKHINAVKIAKISEKAGASAVCIHARTQKQGYSGKTDWDLIKKIKESVKIPVIGNGDVFSPEDFAQKLKFSNVDYIMIGRGAIGNPFIFKQINDFLNKGKYKKEVNKKKLFSEYLKLAIKHKIEFKQIKNQAIYFTKGMQGGAKLREAITRAKDIKEVKEILKKT